VTSRYSRVQTNWTWCPHFVIVGELNIDMLLCLCCCCVDVVVSGVLLLLLLLLLWCCCCLLCCCGDCGVVVVVVFVVGCCGGGVVVLVLLLLLCCCCGGSGVAVVVVVLLLFLLLSFLYVYRKNKSQASGLSNKAVMNDPAQIEAIKAKLQAYLNPKPPPQGPITTLGPAGEAAAATAQQHANLSSLRIGPVDPSNYESLPVYNPEQKFWAIALGRFSRQPLPIGINLKEQPQVVRLSWSTQAISFDVEDEGRGFFFW